MQLLQLTRPLQRAAAAAAGSVWAAASLAGSLSHGDADRLTKGWFNGAVDGRRYASVRAQGVYKQKPKRTIPKKLGAKRTGDQFVIPGNIIYKQRGTVWHPGENAYLGRDHTIHSAVTGYVKYYRDPLRHPDRQYIGVVLDREDKLPYPPGSARKRKLNLVAVPRRPRPVAPPLLTASRIPRYVLRRPTDIEYRDEREAVATNAEQDAAEAEIALAALDGKKPSKKTRSKAQHLKARSILTRLQRNRTRKATRILRLQPDYSYRETNWEIGRLVGPVGVVGGSKIGHHRRAYFRNRRARREHELRLRRKVMAQKKVRRKDFNDRVAQRRRIRRAEVEKAEREERERRVRKMKADRKAMEVEPKKA